MSKYDTLDRLKGTWSISMQDFLTNHRRTTYKDPDLSEVEMLIVDMIHKTNIPDVHNYEVSLVLKKKFD